MRERNLLDVTVGIPVANKICHSMWENLPKRHHPLRSLDGAPVIIYDHTPSSVNYHQRSHQNPQNLLSSLSVSLFLSQSFSSSPNTSSPGPYTQTSFTDLPLTYQTLTREPSFGASTRISYGQSRGLAWAAPGAESEGGESGFPTRKDE